MIDANDMAWIRREVARQVSILMHGETADTNIDDAVGTESVDKCPPGAPTVEGRPVMHPFGMVSRAPKGTIAVVARVGEHPGNKMIVGHRDKNRPQLSAAGEVMIYDAFGNKILLQDGKIVVTLDGTLELGANASKAAARKGDEVECYIPQGAVVISVAGGVGTVNPNPIKCSGTITGNCSSKVKIVD